MEMKYRGAPLFRGTAVFLWAGMLNRV